MIFKRSKSKIRFSRHTTAPGLKVGRYESGLEAIWAWEQLPHLLVIERESYGAGENLVRFVARKYDGERAQLDPKGGRWPRHEPWMHMTSEECAAEIARLGTVALERAARIEGGEEIAPMLVTIPELHDILDEVESRWAPYDELGKQFMNGLGRLLRVGRAGRVHVLASVRQHKIYPAYLPVETRAQFPGLLVLGKTSDAVTRQLGLPYPFNRPHGRLGDLGDDFWPLEVRTR
jgi:hypothetical protein